MAVQMMSTIQRWEGLSVAGGDTKPVAPTFVGSTYYETDTGRTYLWNGVIWVIMPVHILNVQGGGYTIQELMEAFQAMPDLALRTTMIVGFPGETDAEFAELLDFVREVRFYALGAFVFSPEPYRQLFWVKTKRLTSF